MTFAFIMLLTALGITSQVIKRKGLTGWDDVPWFLRGAGAVFFFQFKYAFTYPKQIGVWKTILKISRAGGTRRKASSAHPDLLQPCRRFGIPVNSVRSA